MKLADDLSRHKISRYSKFGQSELFTLELPASIAEKTIFDHLGMLDSGEGSVPFGRFVILINSYCQQWCISRPVVTSGSQTSAALGDG